MFQLSALLRSSFTLDPSIERCEKQMEEFGGQSRMQLIQQAVSSDL